MCEQPRLLQGYLADFSQFQLGLELLCAGHPSLNGPVGFSFAGARLRLALLNIVKLLSNQFSSLS